MEKGGEEHDETVDISHTVYKDFRCNKISRRRNYLVSVNRWRSKRMGHRLPVNYRFSLLIRAGRNHSCSFLLDSAFN